MRKNATLLQRDVSSLSNLPALRSGDGAYQSGVPFAALRGLLREFANHPQNPGDFKIVTRHAAALQAAALLAGSTSEPYNLDLVTRSGQRARLLINHLRDHDDTARPYDIFDVIVQTLIGNQMSSADRDRIDGALTVGGHEVELTFTQGRYSSYIVNRLLPSWGVGATWSRRRVARAHACRNTACALARYTLHLLTYRSRNCTIYV